MKKTRFIEIDILRGLAILGMITIHIISITNYDLIFQGLMNSGSLHILLRCTQITFITLVGTCLAISLQKSKLKNSKCIKKFYKKQFKRSFIILCCALLISIVSYLSIKEYIVFGILHFIGISIIITMPFADMIITPLILSIASFVLKYYINNIFINNSFFIIFGLIAHMNNFVDFFPLIPWISAVFLGISIGNILYKNGERNFKPLQNRFKLISKMLSFLGSRSLQIYIIHIPIILIIVKLVNIIKDLI